MTITVTTQRLPRQLQRLIDARLDTIDRMLLGRLPRADRLAVVREVEAQVHDLLGERPGNELDREDVLTVLAKLDPPEAYLPEEGGYEATAVLLPSRAGRTSPATGERKPALILGILGLLLLGFVALWPLTLMILMSIKPGDEAIYLLIGESILMTVAGLPLFVLSIIYRHGGGWAILAMVSGIIGMIGGLLTGGLVFVL